MSDLIGKRQHGLLHHEADRRLEDPEVAGREIATGKPRAPEDLDEGGRGLEPGGRGPPGPSDHGKYGGIPEQVAPKVPHPAVQLSLPRHFVVGE